MCIRDSSNGMYLELTLNLAGDTDASAFYLYKPYIREDEGGSYVMKVGPDNRLYKQYLSLGKSIYSGEYVEVKGGLTQEDYIAFPYGNDVKEGVRAVVQGTEDPPFADVYKRQAWPTSGSLPVTKPMVSIKSLNMVVRLPFSG